MGRWLLPKVESKTTLAQALCTLTRLVLPGTARGSPAVKERAVKSALWERANLRNALAVLFKGAMSQAKPCYVHASH